MTLSPALSQGRGSSPPPLSLAWLVWGLGASFYLIAFFQRVAPAVVTRELSTDFSLSAAALGNLSAFYFYSYVAVQIPTGLAADRWGPRRLLAGGAFIAALGTLVFALAPGLEWASAGRLIVGATVGVAFVSMLKIATHWMPASQFVLASSVAMVVGVTGATLAGAPLRAAVDAFGWRPVMVASAIVTAIVAAAIWVVVRDDPAERGFTSYYPAGAHREATSMMQQLREVLSYRNTWLLLLIPGAISGIVLSVAGLWGVPFLESQYGFSPREAALIASGMLVAWSLSSVAYGPLSQRIGRRKPVFIGGVAVAMALWAVVVFVPELPRGVLLALLAGTAAASGAFVVTFAFAKESVPARLGGTVSGIANMGVMLGGMFMQPLVGLVLDSHWDGRIVAGARFYDFGAWQAGFSLMLVWGAASLVMLAFTRETCCRQMR